MTKTTTDLVRDLTGSFETFQRKNTTRIDAIEQKAEEAIQAAAEMNRRGLGGPLPSNKPDLTEAASAFWSMVQKRPVLADAAMVESYEEYRSAVLEYCRVGKDGVSSEIMNKLSVGVDPEGGFFVPPEVVFDIVKAMTDISPMRNLARVRVISSDALVGPYRRTRAGVVWVAEGAEPGETQAPEWGAYRIPVHTAAAEPQVTLEMLEDPAVNMGEILTEELAEAFGEEEGAVFVTGAGVGKPRGFLDYAGAAVTTDDKTRTWGELQYIATGAAGGFPTVSGITADDPNALRDVVAALKPKYRANARWLMNRATENLVSKLKDGDGKYLWKDRIDEAHPNMLLGYPVATDEEMPDVGSDSFSIAFGDWRAGYTIVDRLQMTILRDPYTKKGFVKFYTRKRVGGDVVNFEAIKLLKFAAS